MSDREWSLGQSDDAENGGSAGMSNDTSTPSHPPGNRPAQGAARVDTTNQLDVGWQGGAGATDFLGLEPDLRGSSVFASPHANSGSNLGTAPNAGESWLLSVEDASQSARSNFAPTTNDAQNSDVSDIATATENAFDEAVAPETDPEADEVAPIELAPTRRSNFPRWIAIAAGVCALAAGGWYFQHWRATHRTNTTIDTPLATKPTTKPTNVAQNAPKKPSTKPSPKNTNPEVATAPTETPETSPQIVDPSTPIESNEVVIEPTPPVDASATTPVAADPALIAALENAPDSATDFATEPAAPLNVITNNTAPVTLRGLPVLPAFEGQLPARRLPSASSSNVIATSSVPENTVRKATNEDFANLWREPTIPTEAIRGDKRLRTINVGRVRALLQDGEYFEGALYAVGEGRIWLELDLGRISFDASSVSELTQVRGGSQRVGKANPNGDLSGLPRVEVRVPGGIFVGRLVARVEDRITLVTDAGLRLIVDSNDVRPVSATSTRLVGTVEGAVRAEEKPVNTLEKMLKPVNKAKPTPAVEKPKKPLKKP